MSLLSKTLGEENRCSQSCRLSNTLLGKVSCPSSRYHFNKGIWLLISKSSNLPYSFTSPYYTHKTEPAGKMLMEPPLGSVRWTSPPCGQTEGQPVPWRPLLKAGQNQDCSFLESLLWLDTRSHVNHFKIIKLYMRSSYKKKIPAPSLVVYKPKSPLWI